LSSKNKPAKLLKTSLMDEIINSVLEKRESSVWRVTVDYIVPGGTVDEVVDFMEKLPQAESIHIEKLEGRSQQQGSAPVLDCSRSCSSIGVRIQTKRIDIGMSQTELAKKVNVKQGTISYWEAGEYNPVGNRLRRLAEALGVSQAYLLGETVYQGRDLDEQMGREGAAMDSGRI